MSSNDFLVSFFGNQGRAPRHVIQTIRAELNVLYRYVQQTQLNINVRLRLPSQRELQRTLEQLAQTTLVVPVQFRPVGTPPGGQGGANSAAHGSGGNGPRRRRTGLERLEDEITEVESRIGTFPRNSQAYRDHAGYLENLRGRRGNMVTTAANRAAGNVIAGIPGVLIEMAGRSVEAADDVAAVLNNPTGRTATHRARTRLAATKALASLAGQDLGGGVGAFLRVANRAGNALHGNGWRTNTEIAERRLKDVETAEMVRESAIAQDTTGRLARTRDPREAARIRAEQRRRQLDFDMADEKFRDPTTGKTNANGLRYRRDRMSADYLVNARESRDAELEHNYGTSTMRIAQRKSNREALDSRMRTMRRFGLKEQIASAQGTIDDEIAQQQAVYDKIDANDPHKAEQARVLAAVQASGAARKVEVATSLTREATYQDNLADIVARESQHSARSSFERSNQNYGVLEQARDIRLEAAAKIDAERLRVNNVVDPDEKAREEKKFVAFEKKVEAEKYEQLADLNQNYRADMKSLQDSEQQNLLRAAGNYYQADYDALKSSWDRKISLEKDAGTRVRMERARDAELAAKSGALTLEAERRNVVNAARERTFGGDAFGAQRAAVESNFMHAAKERGLIDEKTGKLKNRNTLDQGQQKALDSLLRERDIGLAEVGRRRTDAIRGNNTSAQAATLRSQGQYQRADLEQRKEQWGKEIREARDDPELLKSVMARQSAEQREMAAGGRQAEMHGSVSSWLNDGLMKTLNNDQSVMQELLQLSKDSADAAKGTADKMNEAADKMMEAFGTAP